MDGPELVSQAIKKAADEAGLEARFSPRATDNGYYAWHSYVKIPTQIILNDSVIDVVLQVEFQSTTLLQSALRGLTHALYEERRLATPKGRLESRWDYASRHFRGEFLGHTLHLVDAMILELRDGDVSNAGHPPVESITNNPGDLVDAIASDPGEMVGEDIVNSMLESQQAIDPGNQKDE